MDGWRERRLAVLLGRHGLGGSGLFPLSETSGWSVAGTQLKASNWERKCRGLAESFAPAVKE